jgi:Leucine-rich repeat (LRR) protein
MKQSQLKQLIKEQILVEVKAVSHNQQIYGETINGERIELELNKQGVLFCRDKDLKTLVVNNPQVKEIYCDDNQLTILELGRLPNLEKLYCYNNQLKSLNVLKCSNLESLLCNNNQLTTLDISKCPNLGYLACQYNLLTTLDVSMCPKLWRLDYDKKKTKLIKVKLN